MKNITIRIMLTLLVVTTVVASFAFNASAITPNASLSLLEGLDFETLEPGDSDGDGVTDGEGVTDLSNKTHIANTYGILFNDNNAVIRKYGDDGRLFIKSPTFLTVANNKALEDLLFTAYGPSRFKIEMDIAILNDFGGTGEENQPTLFPTSKYRGMSILTIGGQWLIKATAPGVGMPTVVGEEKVVTGTNGAATISNRITSVAEPVANDVGYFYTSNQIASYWYSADSKVGYAGKGYNVAGADGAVPTEGTYLDGHITGGIAVGAIENGCTYKVGEEVHITLDCIRDTGKNYTYVNVYVGDQLCGTSSYNHNTTTASNRAIRITDLVNGSCVTVDDMKVTVLECGGDHDNIWNITQTVNVDSNNALAFDNVCNVCGGVGGSYANVIKDEADAPSNNGKVNDGKFSASVGGQTVYFASVKGDYWTEMIKAPYWINFDIDVSTVVSENEGERESFLTWMYKNGNYQQLLNLHKTTIDNGDGTSTVKGKVTLYGAKATEWPFYEVAGGKYSYRILIDPETGYYEVYVTDEANGIFNKYLGSATIEYLKSTVAITADATFPAFRFGDARAGSFTVSNLTVTRNVSADEHSHVAPLYKKDMVAVDDASIAHVVYECYCGKNHVEEIKSLVVDNIADLKEGTKTISYTAPTEEYWVSSEINLKTLTADGALLTIGDTAVLKLEGGKLVSGDYSADAASKAYSVAVMVNGNAYVLYLDGEFVSEGVLSGDAKITYGAEGLDASFNYNKIAILDVLGEGVAPVVPTVGIDRDTVECAHSFNVNDKSTKVDYSGDVPKVVYVCSKCGEKVYEELSENIPTYGDTALTTAANYPIKAATHRFVYYDAKLAGKDTANYWVDFDFTLSTISSPTSNYYNQDKTTMADNGRSVVNFGTNYNSFVRAHVISRGNKYTLTAGKSETTAEYLYNSVSYGFGTAGKIEYARMIAGTTLHFSIYVQPATNAITVFVNGEYIVNATNYLGAGIQGTGYNLIRFGDSTTGDYIVDNLTIRRGENEHTHTNLYSGNADGVVSADSWFGLDTYTCYCGAKVAKSGTSDNKVVADDKIESKGSVTLPALTDYWFATDVHVKSLSNTVLIADGDNALVSLKDGKLLACNDADTKLTFSANTTYQLAMQVVPVDNTVTYDLYVDGKFVGNYVGDFVSSNVINLGNEGLEGINFLYTKVVEVGDYFTAVAPDYNEVYTSDCVHAAKATENMFITVPGEIYSSGVKGVNKLIYSYICTKCGERIYEMQGDILQVNDPKDSTECPLGQDTNGSLVLDEYGNLYDNDGTPQHIQSVRYIRTDVASIGSHVDPYWISFDFGTLGITEGQVKNIAASGKSNGGSVFALQVKDANVYHQMLRGYGVLLSDEDANNPEFKDFVEITVSGKTYKYYNDRIGLKNTQTPRPTKKSDESFVMVMGTNTVYNVSIYVEPCVESNKLYWTVYVDGVATTTRGGGASSWFNCLLDHFALRFLDGNYGSFFIENFSLVRATKGEHVDVDLPENMTYGNNVNVLEFTASLDNSPTDDSYYPLVTLKRDYADIVPLFVNASTGDLAYRIGKYSNGYKSLGYTLTNEPSDIVIIYDEIANTIRYHFDGLVVDNLYAQNAYFATMDGAQKDFVRLLTGGYGGLKVNITLDNAYSIGTSGTPEVVGYQVNEINGYLRMITGVNTEYYNEVGGYVELYANDTLVKSAKANSPVVYEDFIANDLNASAGDYGYKYVSILPIEWQDGEVKFADGTEYYIIFRPYSVINGVECYGEPVKIDISYVGGSVGFSFDANYSIKLVSKNIDKYTYSVYPFSLNTSVIGSLVPKVMTPVADGMGGAHFYLRKSFYEFSVKPDSANGAFIVLDCDRNTVFNLWINGAETPVVLNATLGRNYLPIEGLVAGQDNTVKISQENNIGGTNYSDTATIFNGILLNGDLVSAAAAE